MLRFIVGFFLCLASLSSAQTWTRSPNSANGVPGPGSVDVHHNSSNRRAAWLNNVFIQKAPSEFRDETWRSTDSGNTWTKIDSISGEYSGCLLSGKDSLIYQVWMIPSNDSIQWNYFKYNKATPIGTTRRPLYTNADISNSGRGQEYREVSCAVDSNGVIYAITGWAPAAAPTHDRIYAFRLRDTTTGWEGPYQVSDSNALLWTYPQIEVDYNNRAVATYSQDGGAQSYDMFARAVDTGRTWTNVKVDSVYPSSVVWDNLSLLPYSPSIEIIIGQRGNSSSAGQYHGVWIKVSTDSGATWPTGGWYRVDSTCGYGDPSLSIDTAGKLYAAFRSSHNTGITTGTCGLDSRFKLSVSSDTGKTWTGVDSLYPPAARTGTRNSIRFQNWHNYGGPLSWSWMQLSNEAGTNRPTYFNVNYGVPIKVRNGDAVPRWGPFGENDIFLIKFGL